MKEFFKSIRIISLLIMLLRVLRVKEMNNLPSCWLIGGELFRPQNYSNEFATRSSCAGFRWPSERGRINGAVSFHRFFDRVDGMRSSRSELLYLPMAELAE